MSAILEELGTAIREIVTTVGPVVVRVAGGWRGASGVVTAAGRVVTNAHNVRGEGVEVTFGDGRSAAGSLAGMDADGDLAVITVDTGGITPVPISTAVPTLGAPVFAVAATTSGSRITFGLISGVQRSFRGPGGQRISGSIEHTAPMAPGSSGSALVDGAGRLLGINTNRVGGGFYLAMATDGGLLARIEALARGEVPRRPRLGIGLAPARAARQMRLAVGLPDRDGLLVRDVDPDGPAGLAGIDVGDLLTTAAGKTLASVDDLADALGAVPTATVIDLGVVRGVEERTVRVVLGS